MPRPRSPAAVIPAPTSSPPPARSSRRAGSPAPASIASPSQARVNKAMIYYHFSSKIGLYREVLRDGFRRLTDDARAAIAEAPSAIEKFDALHRQPAPHGTRRPAHRSDHAPRDRRRRPQLRRRDAAPDDRPVPRREGDPRRGRSRRRVPRGRPACSPTSWSWAARCSTSPTSRFARRSAARACSAATPQIPSGNASMARHLGTVLRRTLCVDEEVPTMRDRPVDGRSARRSVAAGVPHRRRPADRVRVSGHVEATEVQVSAAGRRPAARAARGRRRPRRRRRRRSRGSTPRDTELALAARRRPSASRPTRSCGCCAPDRAREDIRQAEAQCQAANADVEAARGGARRRGGRPRALRGAARVERRLAQAARRCGGAARRGERRGCRPRASARAPREETVARLRGRRAPRGDRGGRARGVAAVDAQIATLEKAIADATVTAPVAGIVTEKLVDGELIAPRTPLVVDHRPRSRVGRRVRATSRSCRGSPRPGGDAASPTRAAQASRHGHLHLAEGRVHAAQRADRGGAIEARVPRRRSPSTTRSGVLKPGMPVEAELPLQCQRRPWPPSSLDGVDEALRRACARSTACRSRRRAGRDVRPDRPGRRRQDDDDPAAVRAAARRRRARCACSATIRSREHRAASRASVGYLSQRFSLYGDLSIDENIAFFAEIHGLSRLPGAARSAARADAAHAVPRPARRPAVGRHEAEARARLHARPRAARDPARRADDRRRPGVAPRVLEAAVGVPRSRASRS